MIKEGSRIQGVFTIVYDIRCPPSGPGSRDYNPANLLPANHPQKGWTRHQFYAAIGRALREMGFISSQYSMYSRYCSENYALHSAYTLHQSNDMSWLPFCLRRMHVVKLVSLESVNVPSTYGPESDEYCSDDSEVEPAYGDHEDGDYDDDNFVSVN
ncbi:hypothetical protein ACTFIW_011996 [Dictyostelium discoideum]